MFCITSVHVRRGEKHRHARGMPYGNAGRGLNDVPRS